MNYYLENTNFRAEIKSKGAELCSFKNTKTNTEYIWQGDPKFWNRHAPVLFPIVGKLKNNQYHFEGKTYQMSQHGFARDKEFVLLSQSADELIFELREDAETLEKYPFEFILQISYQLKTNILTTKYSVQNPSTSNLYFSIGGHPAYRCPLKNGEKRSDYFLEFEASENAKRFPLEAEGVSLDSIPVFEKNGILPITDSLFEADALVFKDLKSEVIRIKNQAQRMVLEFRFQGFPFFGIWSKNQQSPFVCLEPWCGVADCVNHEGDLTKKEGIISLKTGEIFERSYEVEVF